MKAHDRHLERHRFDPSVPDFVRDHATAAPCKLLLGGLLVWLGCLTLMSCVGSVINITAGLLD
jgi:hypothetical protein